MKPAIVKNSSPVQEARPAAAALQMYLETLSYKTRERLELINITRDLNDVVKKHGLKAGFVLVQSLHTTTAVFINEFQHALLDDIKSFIERLVGRFEYLAAQRSQSLRMSPKKCGFASARHAAGPHYFAAGKEWRSGAGLLAVGNSGGAGWSAPTRHSRPGNGRPETPKE